MEKTTVFSRRHWVFRTLSALVALLIVVTSGSTLAEAAQLHKENDERFKSFTPLGYPVFERARTEVVSEAPRRRTSAGPDVPQVLLPARLEALGSSRRTFDPWLLFDGDATTGVSGAFRLRVQLSEPVRLSHVGLSTKAKGTLRVFRERGGELASEPELSIEAAAGAQQGWLRAASPHSDAARSVVVEWLPALASGSGPVELSLWALQPQPRDSNTSARDRLFGDGVPGGIDSWAAPRKVAVTRNATSSLTAELGQDPRSFGRAFLVYELIGAAHPTNVPHHVNRVALTDTTPSAPTPVSTSSEAGSPAAIGSGGLQVEEISPSWLVRGQNRISFGGSEQLGTYFVRNLRLVGVPRDGTASGAFERVTRSGAPNAWRAALSFEQPTEVHEVVFRLERKSSARLMIGGAALELSRFVPGWQRAAVDLPAAAELDVELVGSREEASPPVSALHVAGSPAPGRAPRLVVTHPGSGECPDGVATLRGFVASAGGARLSLDGRDASASLASSGTFDLRVEEPRAKRGKAWSIELGVADADGRRASETVQLGPCVRGEDLARAELAVDPGAPFGALVRAGRAQRVVLGTATLDVPAGAVERDVVITARPLTKEQVATFDPSMVNVMPDGQAYRFGPHGLKFKKPVKLSLSYDPSKLPGGTTDADVFAFFFNESTGRWERVGRIEASGGEIVALTEHFTDYVAATIAQPDTPGAQTFNPTAMKDMQQADPGAGIQLIAPPSGNHTGSAQIGHPIEVPPGRGGVQPGLGFSYDSNASNGWLGVGWGLRLPSIRIDTRFGVPHYTGEEAYLLDGAALVPVAGAQGAPGANPRHYQRRIEGSFDRIERHGTDPTNYYWVVTPRSGTRSVFGRCPRPGADPSCVVDGATAWSKLEDPRAVAGAGTVSEWFLESMQDPSGNRLDVRYFRDLWQRGERFAQLYPKRIDYTSHVTSSGVQDLAPAYRVEFALARQTNGTLLERQDVVLDARAGFPTAVRYLLGHVDVKLMQGAGGEEIIRRYRLDYRHADLQTHPEHLGKTLLEHVTMLGVGAEHELYRHSFDYFGAEKDADNRPLLFSEQKTWGSALRKSDGLTRTEDDTFGGSGSVGIGIGPFSLSASAGGFSGNDEVKLAPIDVSGDGIADQLDDHQAAVFGFLNRTPTIAVPVASGGFTSALALLAGPRSGELGHTNRSGWSVEGALNIGGVFGASLGYTRTNTNDDHALADMDGDGFVDLVGVDDGFVTVRRGLGGDRFDTVAVPWGGQIAASEHTSSQADRDAAASDQIHPVDPLVKWQAPIDGTVALTGAIKKLVAGGDGVIARIFHNSTLVWARTFAADDLADCVPGPSNGCGGGLSFVVNAADRIYLTASSPVDPNAVERSADIDKDDLAWPATFTYTGLSAATLSERQPYGGLTHLYSTADDFRLAGLPAVPWVASGKGKVVIEGAISKSATTADDVHASITRNGHNDEVFGADFEAGELADVTVGAAIDVQGGERLYFDVTADSQIDPNGVGWQPIVRYTEYCRFDKETSQEVCGAVQCGPESSTDPRITCRIANDPDPFVRIPLELIVQVAQVHYPAPRWEPPIIHPEFRTFSAQHVSIGSHVTKGPTPEPVLVLVQGVNRLYYKRWFAASELAVDNQTLELDLPPGEQLFFTIYSDAAPGFAFDWNVDVNGTAASPTLRLADPSPEPMSGGFHGFFYGDWNGALAFHESSIVAEPPTQGMPFMFVTPQRQGRPSLPLPMWVGRGADGYIAAGRMKPSRLGAFGTGASGGSGGLEELRASENWNATLGVTVLANLTGSVGDTTSQLDLIDFNGDRYPDLLTSNGVLINDAPNRTFVAKDALGDVDFPDGDFEDMRRYENRTAGIALSAGRQIIQKTDAKGKTKGFVTTTFRVGVNYGLTGAATELFDVNGDGLPDHLYKDPTSNQMKVRLNLGYSFSQPITWQSPDWSVEHITELQEILTKLPLTDAVKTGAMRLDDTVALNVGLGANVGPFGGGAGLTLTTARQNVDFVDVNGDGLIDQVMRNPRDEDGPGHEWIRVKLNLGDRFAAEQLWPMPAWTTTVDPGEFLPLDEPVKISGQKALSFKRAKALSGSFEVEVCIILCAGATFYYQQGSGYAALEFQDIDGDGRPDHVLKKHDDQNVYVKLNKLGKTNLLRAVKRPLGGSFELDYQRRGNRVDPHSTPAQDMPEAAWVLSKTITKASPVATPSSTGSYLVQTYEYDDAFYDRAERESYGFGRVRMRRGTFDAVSGQYQNGDGSSSEYVFENRNYYQQGLLLEVIERGKNPKRLDLGFEAVWVKQTLDYADPPPEVLAQVGRGTFFPRERARETAWFEGQTNALTKAKRESAKEYDSSGNLTRMLDEGDADISGDEVRYAIEYSFEPSRHIFRPTLVRALTPEADPSAPAQHQILRERKATYDDRGRMTSLTQLLRGGKDPSSPDGSSPYTGATNPTWTFGYEDASGNDFGNITSTTDPKGFVTHYEYDAVTRTHRAKTSDGFGYSSKTSTNLRFGTPSAVEDRNGHQVLYCYDEFGRIARLYGPNDIPPGGDGCGVSPPTEPTIAYGYGTTGNDAAQAPFPAWAFGAHKDVQHPGDPIVTSAFIDGMGRTLQIKKDVDKDNGPGSGVGAAATTTGMSVSGLVELDARGRVRAEHQPTFSTAPAHEFVAAPASHPVVTEYDVMDRGVRIQSPNGTESVTEHGIEVFDGKPYFRTRVRDAKHNVRMSYADSDGSTVAVVEHNRLGDLAGADHCEPGAPGCVALTTRYAFDSLNQMVSVSDAKGNTTSAVFDSLGRMVELDSPDAGKTEWSFDLGGNLAARQTARLRAQSPSTRITYEYDFNRLKKIVYPDMPAVEYFYGAAADKGDANGNVAARLTEERSEAGVKRFAYDRLGNVVREESAIVNITNTETAPYTQVMSYEYDSFGRMLQMQFPGGGKELVQYKYDRGGRIQSIFGDNTEPDPKHPSAEVHTDYAKHIGYDEFDQKRRMVGGNDIETTYDYDPVMRRLSNVFSKSHDTYLRKAGKPARVFQDVRYQYDAVGSLTEIRNDAPFDDKSNSAVLVGTTKYTFAYDDLNQLRRADAVLQERTQWQYRHFTTMAYDEIGNLTKKVQQDDRYKLQQGSYAFNHTEGATSYSFDYFYESGRPHALSRTNEVYTDSSGVKQRTFDYDASGNMTGSAGENNVQRAQVWDSEDRLKSVEDNGNEEMKALYDASGRRTSVATGGQQAVYANQFVTDRFSQNGQHYVTKHIYADGVHVADKIDADWMSKPPTFHYHSDHLGSSSYVSNGDQDLVQHDEYFASGEPWYNQTDSKYSFRKGMTFNDKELDTSTGYYYFGARYYEPRLGQWNSPDPELAGYMQGKSGGVGMPRNLGLYTYTWNNPVMLRDPTGRSVLSTIGDIAEGLYDVGTVAVRTVTNFLGPAVFYGALMAAGAVLTGGLSLTLMAGAFTAGFSKGLAWSTGTNLGKILSGGLGIVGLIHGHKLAEAGSYKSAHGFLAFILDNTWSLLDTIGGSFFALLPYTISAKSKGSGTLYFDKQWQPNTDYTVGNVTIGTTVPAHEATHAWQQRLFGPFYVPIYIGSTAINIIPWWLIPKWLGAWGNQPIKGIGDYYQQGMYAFNIMEITAYLVQGHPAH